MKNFMTRAKGFTLIELIVVIGIIAVLAAIVIVAINPARQFALARNSARKSDINAILNAIGQFTADPTNESGSLPAGIDGTVRTICTSNDDATCGAGLLNIADELTPTYITAIPKDRQATVPSSGYTVVSSGGRVTVAAPLAELGETISVTR